MTCLSCSVRSWPGLGRLEPWLPDCTVRGFQMIFLIQQKEWDLNRETPTLRVNVSWGSRWIPRGPLVITFFEICQAWSIKAIIFVYIIYLSIPIWWRYNIVYNNGSHFVVPSKLLTELLGSAGSDPSCSSRWTSQRQLQLQPMSARQFGRFYFSMTHCMDLWNYPSHNHHDLNLIGYKSTIIYYKSFIDVHVRT